MRVALCDVGPRDGLQNEPEILGPTVRAELVERLASTGLPRVEVASFVRDDLVPQMAEAEAVVASLVPHAGVMYSGLVLNARGYDRLRQTQRFVRFTSPSPPVKRSSSETRGAPSSRG